MFRTDCVDKNGTHILDLTLIKIIQHKCVHCYALHTFPSFFYFICGTLSIMCSVLCFAISYGPKLPNSCNTYCRQVFCTPTKVTLFKIYV